MLYKLEELQYLEPKLITYIMDNRYYCTAVSFSHHPPIMVLGARLTVFVAICLVLVSGCEEGHDHDSRRLQTAASLTPPTRPLQWGDLNVIHTTDTHGWLLGHQKKSFPEPNYSGDFGDFASFISHMKQIAEQKDVDLLLVDSGDLHDGTGLVDGFPPGGIDGHDALQFFKRLPYDVLAIGNHELYSYNVTLDMHRDFAPRYEGRYLSSNVNITYVDNTGKVVNTTVGSRFAKFKTRKGRQVTAFGVLFDFRGNDDNTTVQKVEDMVKETWFLEAIKDEPDFFLLVGHMPIARDKWPLVYNAIRAVHPNAPILIFGGHTHIRDCLQFDGRSMALESGRYMETLGWMSVNLDKSDSAKNLTFSRRYLDPNRVTYEYHTRKSDYSFDTQGGKNIRQGLQALSKQFYLDYLFGMAPHDFAITRAPYPSDYSSLSLFIEEATPTVIRINNTRTNAFIAIANSGSQRFDILSGPFTKNDQLTTSPFLDSFLYIPDVPLRYAKQVVTVLNQDNSVSRRDGMSELEEREKKLYGVGEVEMVYRRWLEEMGMSGAEEMKRRTFENNQTYTPGYVTKDSCPGIGDDTLHTPLPYFSVPDYIASRTPPLSDDTPIDLVFFDFIASLVVKTLNKLQNVTMYTASQAKLYSPYYADQVLGVYAQAKWN